MLYRKVLLRIIVVSVALSLLECPVSWAGTTAKYHLEFTGTGSGGTLVLGDTVNRISRYVSIPTFAGESCDSVASRLASAINAAHASAGPNLAGGRAGYRWHRLWAGDYQAVASDGTVSLGAGGGYVLAGTEHGLGIPKPPLSLSCSYDPTEDAMILHWENPPGGYEHIGVAYSPKARDLKLWTRISGDATTHRIDRKKRQIDLNDTDIILTGYNGTIPSNCAGVHLSKAGACQAELYGIPFSANVAPNWSKWSTANTLDPSAFEQAMKYEFFLGGVETLLGKPFYQVIKAPAEGQSHGIRRRFLGLSPGHSYRLAAAVNSLKMDSVNGDWELAICAAANGADSKDLTSQQMAGLATLPDGSKGLEAGRVALYDSRNTTRGMWEMTLTGYKAGRRPAGSHITLPSDANSITVWIRFSCSDPNGRVAFSGVALEDMTAAGKRLKTAEEVIEENRTEQATVLKRQAQIKRRAARRKNPE
jgi:hypothetical protein